MASLGGNFMEGTLHKKLEELETSYDIRMAGPLTIIILEESIHKEEGVNLHNS